MNFESFRESKTGTLKKLEKASALSASDKPEDQDRAREYRVAADFKSWRNQKRSGKLKEGGIPKQSKPNEPYDGGKPVEEEVGISSAAAMEKARQEAKLRKKEQDAVRKEKEAVKKEEDQLERALDTFEKGEKERIVKGMKKSSKDLKNRYGKDWKSVMYATATKKAKEEGDTSKSDKRYAYEEFEDVAEYFYNEGINEEGLDIIIEEVGLEEFVDFVEERSARKMNVRTKGSIKKQTAKDTEAEEKRRKAKTHEYKETHKKKPRVGAPSYSTKVTGAVKKAKAKQPTKKASKEGIRTKIAGAVKKGVERHKSAVKKSKFASGVKSGAKSVGKFIRDVDSVLKVNKKTTVNMQSYEPELPMIDELNRYGKETGKATGSLNKRPGSPVKGNKNEPASAVSSVRRSIRRETGRPEGQQKKKRGAKVDPQAYGQPETSVQRIKKYLEKKRAAQADPSQGRYPPGSRKD